MSIRDSWNDEKGLSSISASAELTGNKPGEFLFTFEGLTPDYFTVLAVDYDRYSAAYACRQVNLMIKRYYLTNMKKSVDVVPRKSNKFRYRNILKFPLFHCADNLRRISSYDIN